MNCVFLLLFYVTSLTFRIGCMDELDTGESLQRQLQVISECSDIWVDDLNFCSYAVTDLDQNGRLEIISSFVQGSGWYSTNLFYAVNERLDGLSVLEFSESLGESEADIVTERAPVYFDPLGNVFYFIFDDTVRDGNGYFYYNKRSISLKNGKLSEHMLANKEAWYQEFSSINNGGRDSIIRCTNREGTEISGEEYDLIADTIFPDFFKMEAHFSWFELDLDASDDIVRRMLTESFEGFQILQGE